MTDGLFDLKTKKASRFLFLAAVVISIPLAVLTTLEPVKTQKSAAGNEAVFSLFPSPQTFPVNSPFTLKTFLDTPKQTKVVIATLRLEFDPKVLQVKKVRGGKDFSNKIKVDFDNKRGTITVKQGVGGGKPAMSGKVEFAQIDMVGRTKSRATEITIDKILSSVVSAASERLPLETKSGVYQLK